MKNDPTNGGLYFDDRWFRVVGTVIFSLVIPPIFFRSSYSNADGYWHSVVISLFYTITIWTLARAVFLRVNHRFPDLQDNEQRILWIVGIIAFIPLIVCPIANVILIDALRHQHEVKDPSWAQKMGSSYILMIAVGAVYEGARYFFLLKKAISEKEQLEKEHLAGQLDSLRNQVNPHFLFNSLNTLTYLIPDEPQKAVRFVQQLSKVYRYVLEHRAEKITSLADELEFLKSYIFLLKERFGDNLTIEIEDFEDRHATGIVPLTLQMLFENAIKHNVISKEKPLTIEVFSEGNDLVVRNNLQRKDQVMHSTGVGLENIRQRYKILTGINVKIAETNGFFSVSLPCAWCHAGQKHALEELLA